MPTFVVRHVEKTRRTWRVPVPETPFVIGRARGSRICIPHVSVSKEHVRIEKRGPRYHFVDLKSRNGTFINEIRSPEGPLEEGDELRIGNFLLTFYEGEPPPSAAGRPPSAAGRPASSPARPSRPSPAPATGRRRAPEGAPSGSGTGGRHAPAGGGAGSGAERGDRPPASAGGEAEGLVDGILADLGLDRAEAEEGGSARDRIHHAETVVQKRPGPAGGDEESGAAGAPRPPPARRRLFRRPREPGAAPAGATAASGRWGTRALVLAALGGLGAGLLGGWVAGVFMAPLPGGPPARGAGPPRVVEETHDPELAALPRWVQEVVGPRADLEDPEVSFRALLRLFMDLLGRPPVRKEWESMRGLSHEERWLRLQEVRPRSSPLEPESLAEVFRRFLGLVPAPGIQERIAARAQVARDPEHVAFLIASSLFYAGPEHRRLRTPRQLAASLNVDLLDVPPGEDRLAEELGGGALEGQRLAALVRGYLDRPEAEAVAPAGAGAGSAEPWVDAAYLRFSGRLPSEAERRRARELLGSEGGWRRLLEELALGREYRSY